MQIYLMRHGEAVPEMEWRKAENTRPLTPRGRKNLEEAIDAMKRTSFRPTSIISSAFDRAQETARMIGEALGVSATPVPELNAGANMNVYKGVIESRRAEGALLIVGHMPDLAMTAARVFNQASFMERSMQPGEMFAAEWDPASPLWNSGQLLWTRTLQEWHRL